MFKTIIFLLCLILASSISSHQHKSPLRFSPSQSHLQASTDDQIKQVEFEQQFTKITNEVDYISRTTDLNDSNKYSFIIQKCKEITSGFTALHRALLKFSLPISPQNKICPGISTFNRSQINRYITYTEKKEAQLAAYEPTCADCSFIASDIDKLLSLTEQYFRLINQTLDGDFCNIIVDEKVSGLVDLNRSYFKNNLVVLNWYYGSISKSEYKIKAFKRSATYNLTSCPKNTPFVRDQEQVCFNCPEGSLYNLGKEICMVCDINQVFNTKSEKCEQCLGKKEIVGQTLICKPCVLADSEVYNLTTGKCQLCTGKRYIDRIDHLCKDINCPAATPRFNNETQACQSCPISEIIDPKDPTVCIKTNYIGICPKQTPFYDNSTHTCEPCPNGTIFNKANNQCQTGNTA